MLEPIAERRPLQAAIITMFPKLYRGKKMAEKSVSMMDLNGTIMKIKYLGAGTCKRELVLSGFPMSIER
jgi:hypothetical protein